MPYAPRPANETERLRALADSGLLESGPNPQLDKIVRQAASLWGTPIAAVVLLDGTHQHYTASVGVDVPRVARDSAFCGYAILQSDPLVVLDAQADWRFVDNPLVMAQPGIRFYAGVPVFGPGGQPFGALCVIDSVKRPAVDDAAVRSLRDLADQVSAVLSAPRKSKS